jgi:hypothetical protein
MLSGRGTLRRTGGAILCGEVRAVAAFDRPRAQPDLRHVLRPRATAGCKHRAQRPRSATSTPSPSQIGMRLSTLVAELVGRLAWLARGSEFQQHISRYAAYRIAKSVPRSYARKRPSREDARAQDSRFRRLNDQLGKHECLPSEIRS